MVKNNNFCYLSKKSNINMGSIRETSDIAIAIFYLKQGRESVTVRGGIIQTNALMPPRSRRSPSPRQTRTAADPAAIVLKAVLNQH